MKLFLNTIDCLCRLLVGGIAFFLLADPTFAIDSGSQSKGTNQMLVKDSHFISATNPMANADQRDIERLAMELVKTPIVVGARKSVEARWKGTIGKKLTNPRAESAFQAYLDSWMFHFALQAVNSDPNYPRILHLSELAHDWFGLKVPDARYGGDNPDTRYVIIPIDNVASYELTGTQLQSVPADISLCLMGNLTPTLTIGILNGRDLVTDDQGRFTVTIGPEPVNSRRNYLQTDPDVRYLYVRDTRGNWGTEVPMALQIKRLTPPTAQPLTIDQLAHRAARFAIVEVPSMAWYVAMFNGVPANEMTPPKSTGDYGGLVSQQTSFGRLELSDENAVLITIGSGGAHYSNLVLQNFLNNALDSANRIISMNHAQARPNADGTVTYVVSLRDPGAFNWIDPMGWHEVFATARWQGLPASASKATTSITTKIVRFADVAKQLPPTLMVNNEQRREQLNTRRAEYLLRFAE